MSLARSVAWNFFCGANERPRDISPNPANERIMKIIATILVYLLVQTAAAQSATILPVDPPPISSSTLDFFKQFDTTPEPELCPGEKSAPGRLQAPGADKNSCVGISYRTLRQSPSFNALPSSERRSALVKWVQTDAKDRELASGGLSTRWRQDMAAIEIDYASAITNQSAGCASG